jgi:hypothetical protein
MKGTSELIPGQKSALSKVQEQAPFSPIVGKNRPESRSLEINK